MCYYRKESWPTNSFVNKRKIIVHLTYAKNDNLSIRVYINTNQDWFYFQLIKNSRKLDTYGSDIMAFLIS